GGGRRYYRPEDIQLLVSIKNYLYKQGYTIKGVQRLLKEGRSSVSENTPSFQAYRRDMADEVAQEIPPEDFDDAFGENASEAAAPLETAPAEGNAVARGLSAVSEIHDQLENPAPPMRVDPAAKPADKKTLNASKLTPAIKTELRGILDELKTLREMLRGGSN
ncbi:MAG: MerR family transcriptional regulator, partial [Proteobacteria bacterium]|nr:MerR family transcriptional regulator [Pseudomonadota bacterium]